MRYFRGGRQDGKGHRTGLVSSLSGAAKYILFDKTESGLRADFFYVRNLGIDDPELVAGVLEARAQAVPHRSDMTHFGYHCGFRLPEGESLSHEQWHELGEQAIDALGADRYPAVIALHTDSEQDHLHIVFSRLADGEPTWIPKYDLKILHEVARDFALQNGLSKPLDPWRDYYARSGISNGAFWENQHRGRGASALAREVDLELGNVFKTALTWDELEANLHASGYHLEASRNGRGILVVEDATGARVGVSSLNPHLSGPKLVRRFGEAFSDYRYRQPTVPALEDLDHRETPALVHDLLESLENRAWFTDLDIHYLARREPYPDRLRVVAEVLQQPGVLNTGFTHNDRAVYALGDYAAKEIRLSELLSAQRAQRVGWSPQLPAELPGLTPSQQSAAFQLVQQGPLGILSGGPGSGKSYSMRAVADIYRANGFEVIGGAVSARAARELQDATGIESRSIASWMKRWIHRLDADFSDRPVLFVLDEASMLGTRDLLPLLEVLQEKGAHLHLVGDQAQLPPIGAGTPFHYLMDTLARSDIAIIPEMQRQSGWMLAATEAMREGRFDEAIAAYREHDLVQHFDHRHDARAYMAMGAFEDYRSGRSSILLARRRQDVAWLNAELRAALRRSGLLGERIHLLNGTEYRAGDRLLFLANAGVTTETFRDVESGESVAIQNGAVGILESGNSSEFTVRLDSGVRVSFSPDEYQSLAHGYATTLHKAQGGTFDKVRLLVDGGYDQRSLLVGASRHRDPVDGLEIVTDRESFESLDQLHESLVTRPLRHLEYLDPNHGALRDVVDLDVPAQPRGTATERLAILAEQRARLASAVEQEARAALSTERIPPNASPEQLLSAVADPENLVGTVSLGPDAVRVSALEEARGLAEELSARRADVRALVEEVDALRTVQLPQLAEETFGEAVSTLVQPPTLLRDYALRPERYGLPAVDSATAWEAAIDRLDGLEQRLGYRSAGSQEARAEKLSENELLQDAQRFLARTEPPLAAHRLAPAHSYGSRVLAELQAIDLQDPEALVVTARLGRRVELIEAEHLSRLSQEPLTRDVAQETHRVIEESVRAGDPYAAILGPVEHHRHLRAETLRLQEELSSLPERHLEGALRADFFRSGAPQPALELILADPERLLSDPRGRHLGFPSQEDHARLAAWVDENVGLLKAHALRSQLERVNVEWHRLPGVADLAASYQSMPPNQQRLVDHHNPALGQALSDGNENRVLRELNRAPEVESLPEVLQARHRLVDAPAVEGVVRSEMETFLIRAARGDQPPSETRPSNEGNSPVAGPAPAPADLLQGDVGAALTRAEEHYRSQRNEASRDLPESILERYGVGLAPEGWRGLGTMLRSEGHTQETLHAAGLEATSERNGQTYDRFRNRMMFPIRRPDGQVVGFGGRDLGSARAPKYINSPDSPHFQKGELLYGFHEAQDAIRITRRAVLTEGYYDVLSLAAAEQAAVAPMGTSFTPHQADLLAEAVGEGGEVVLGFDADAAGVRASDAALRLLLERGVHVRSLELPAGQDADSYRQAHGAEALAALVEASPDALQLRLRGLVRDRAAVPTDEHVQATEAAQQLLRSVRSPELRLQHARDFAARHGVSLELLFSRGSTYGREDLDRTRVLAERNRLAPGSDDTQTDYASLLLLSALHREGEGAVNLEVLEENLARVRANARDTGTVRALQPIRQGSIDRLAPRAPLPAVSRIPRDDFQLAEYASDTERSRVHSRLAAAAEYHHLKKTGFLDSPAAVRTSRLEQLEQRVDTLPLAHRGDAALSALASRLAESQHQTALQRDLAAQWADHPAHAPEVGPEVVVDGYRDQLREVLEKTFASPQDALAEAKTLPSEQLPQLLDRWHLATEIPEIDGAALRSRFEDFVAEHRQDHDLAVAAVSAGAEGRPLTDREAHEALRAVPVDALAQLPPSSQRDELLRLRSQDAPDDAFQVDLQRVLVRRGPALPEMQSLPRSQQRLAEEVDRTTRLVETMGLHRSGSTFDAQRLPNIEANWHQTSEAARVLLERSGQAETVKQELHREKQNLVSFLELSRADPSREQRRELLGLEQQIDALSLAQSKNAAELTQLLEERPRFEHEMEGELTRPLQRDLAANVDLASPEYLNLRDRLSNIYEAEPDRGLPLRPDPETLAHSPEAYGKLRGNAEAELPDADRAAALEHAQRAQTLGHELRNVEREHRATQLEAETAELRVEVDADLVQAVDGAWRLAGESPLVLQAYLREPELVDLPVRSAEALGELQMKVDRLVQQTDELRALTRQHQPSPGEAPAAPAADIDTVHDLRSAARTLEHVVTHDLSAQAPPDHLETLDHRRRELQASAAAAETAALGVREPSTEDRQVLQEDLQAARSHLAQVRRHLELRRARSRFHELVDEVQDPRVRRARAAEVLRDVDREFAADPAASLLADLRVALDHHGRRAALEGEIAGQAGTSPAEIDAYWEGLRQRIDQSDLPETLRASIAAHQDPRRGVDALGADPDTDALRAFMDSHPTETRVAALQLSLENLPDRDVLEEQIATTLRQLPTDRVPEDLRNLHRAAREGAELGITSQASTAAPLPRRDPLAALRDETREQPWTFQPKDSRDLPPLLQHRLALAVPEPIAQHLERYERAWYQARDGVSLAQTAEDRDVAAGRLAALNELHNRVLPDVARSHLVEQQLITAQHHQVRSLSGALSTETSLRDAIHDASPYAQLTKRLVRDLEQSWDRPQLQQRLVHQVETQLGRVRPAVGDQLRDLRQDLLGQLQIEKNTSPLRRGLTQLEARAQLETGLAQARETFQQLRLELGAGSVVDAERNLRREAPQALSKALGADGARAAAQTSYPDALRILRDQPEYFGPVRDQKALDAFLRQANQTERLRTAQDGIEATRSRLANLPERDELLTTVYSHFANASQRELERLTPNERRELGQIHQVATADRDRAHAATKHLIEHFAQQRKYLQHNNPRIPGALHQAGKYMTFRPWLAFLRATGLERATPNYWLSRGLKAALPKSAGVASATANFAAHSGAQRLLNSATRLLGFTKLSPTSMALSGLGPAGAAVGAGLTVLKIGQTLAAAGLMVLNAAHRQRSANMLKDLEQLATGDVAKTLGNLTSLGKGQGQGR